MAHKHHSEKHAKKRHFIGNDCIHSKERMAALRPAEKTVVDETAEHANSVVEPAEQTIDVKLTLNANVAPRSSAMPQQTIQFARKKNVLEKLKDKFHQLMNHFKN